jgi:hypothetical protein
VLTEPCEGLHEEPAVSYTDHRLRA